MNKIYIYQAGDGEFPFLDFLRQADEKISRKVKQGIAALAIYPELEREPYAKYFSIAPYKGLYEYRARIKVPVRVIYTRDRSRDIFLLHPFIKRSGRQTIQALDRSLLYLRNIEKGVGRKVPLQDAYKEAAA